MLAGHYLQKRGLPAARCWNADWVYDSGNNTGGSPFKACIKVPACKLARLAFSVNDSVVGGCIDKLLTYFEDFPTLFFYTFCRVSGIFLLLGYP